MDAYTDPALTDKRTPEEIKWRGVSVVAKPYVPTVPLSPPTYPLRPVNGGRFDKAPAKHGDWAYEPKVNGWRTLVHTPTGTMFNRHGQRLSIEHEFGPALAILKNCPLEWLDCEGMERRHGLLRGCLIVLDWPTEKLSYNVRQAELYTCLHHIPGVHSLAPFAVPTKLTDSVLMFAHTCDGEGQAVLKECWKKLQDLNRVLGCEFYEGFLAKRRDSLYPFQLRSPSEEFPQWVKHRFI